MNKMTYYLVAIVMMIIFTQSVPVNGIKVLADENASLTYEELTIYVMPQYATPDEWEADKPAVLVGVHGTLINESDRAYTEGIRIPTPSEQPNFQFSQAGEFESDGTVRDVKATMEETSGDILWQPEQAIDPGEEYHFLTEYYFSPVNEGISYTFSFTHELERDAKNMKILFFEPYGAENFTVYSDIDASKKTDDYGIATYVFTLDKVENHTVFDTTVTYEKEDTVTTLEAIDTLKEQADVLAQISEEEQAKSSHPVRSGLEVDKVVLFIIGFMVVGLFIFFIRRNNKTRNMKIDERTKKKRDETKVPYDDGQELRNQLIRGEIDEETYQKERSKHSF